MNRSIVALVTIAATFTACSKSASRSGELTEAESAAFQASVAKLRPLKSSSKLQSPFPGRNKAPNKPSNKIRPNSAADNVQPELQWFGGPLLESVELYAVYWGTDVNPATVSGIPGMLSTVHSNSSPYMSMLQMYNNGTPYTIGDGVYKGSIVDTGAPMPADGNITDAMIRGELARLIDTGQLPPNNGRNLYMVYFPLNSGANPITIIQGGGAQSCQVFCAYHNTYVRNGSNVYYGVMPDLDEPAHAAAACAAPAARSTTYTRRRPTR